MDNCSQVNGGPRHNGIVCVYATYTPKETFEFIKVKGNTVMLPLPNGELVTYFKGESAGKKRKRRIRKKLRCFRNSLACANCGAIGTHFQLEQVDSDGGTVRLALYTEDGKEMTVDHIIPKGMGGRDTLSNVQTMCYKCNYLKGDCLGTPKPTHTIGDILEHKGIVLETEEEVENVIQD